MQALLVIAIGMFVLGELVVASKNYSLVLVGGNLANDNAEIWNTIIKLGGGKNVARFGVVASASDDPCCDEDSSWVLYRDLLTSYGAAYVYYIPVTVDTAGNNTNTEVVETVKTLTGFFFGGGDQTRIIRSFYNGDDKIASPLLIAMKETLYATGGVVAGTSAGTDCQTGSVMISNGVTYDGLLDGSFPHWQAVINLEPNKLGGYASGGIGLFPFGLLDTHFENRGRQGRLLRLLSDTMGYPAGHVYAFGVDENTALVVTVPSSSRSCAVARVGSVLGQRGVMLIDITEASVTSTRTESNPSAWGMKNVLISHMTAGDSIDLNTYEITPADYKTALAGSEGNALADISENVFGEDTFEFNRIAMSLFNSKLSNSTFGLTEVTRSPRFKVTMEKGAQGSGGFEGTNPDTGVYSISYSNMRMQVQVQV